ncbi:MAG: zinc ABC transporter substrate-binding protein [Bacilli bacterium]|nr:zinc ABC transporter substrate-binding protein [Bacilli bacterium]
MKKVLILLLIIISITGCTKQVKNEKTKIVTTNFPCYDFVRAITKDVDNIEVDMLVTPGSEIHDYEPTPKDIINIKKSKLFVYTGGESDNWVKKIIKENNNVKIMDLVDLKKEELVEGMEGEDEEEYDEHVWTSPKNAIKIIDKLKEKIIKIDNKNKNEYEKNAEEYIKKIKEIDKEIENIVKTSKRKTIVFADRFPFRYFTDEYGLEYYAAFKGCSESTEASSKTITFLIKKIKEEKIPVVFHIELSNKKIAKVISKETNTKILELNSAHNISKKDFEKGITYVDIMKKNIESLREALN